MVCTFLREKTRTGLTINSHSKCKKSYRGGCSLIQQIIMEHLCKVLMECTGNPSHPNSLKLNFFIYKMGVVEKKYSSKVLYKYRVRSNSKLQSRPFFCQHHLIIYIFMKDFEHVTCTKTEGNFLHSSYLFLLLSILPKTNL